MTEKNEHGTIERYTNQGCRCPRCKFAASQWRQEVKGSLAFDDRRHGSVQGYLTYGCRCGSCKAAKSRYYQASRDARADTQLSKRYGITRDDHDNLIETQGGRCAACQEPCEKFNVDSETSTGGEVTIRGLVCNGCRLVISQVKSERYGKVVIYLNR